MCECVNDMPTTYDKPEVWHAAHLVDTEQVEIGGFSIAILDGYFKAWDRQGREAERARIVALLEAEEWDAPEVAEPYVRHTIALIRGEQS